MYVSEEVYFHFFSNFLISSFLPWGPSVSFPLCIWILSVQGKFLKFPLERVLLYQCKKTQKSKQQTIHNLLMSKNIRVGNNIMVVL